MFPRFAALAITLLLPLAARAQSSSSSGSDPLEGWGLKAPDFTLTDSRGRKVSRADLAGKVWVAHFFFTECTAGCSQTTDNMAWLQKALADCPDVVLVSFTLNPRTDTPEKLREYAGRWQVKPDRWLFLTGDPGTMAALVKDGFKQGFVEKPDALPGVRIEHPWRVILVDRSGTMRGFIRDGRDMEEVRRLERRARQLSGGSLRAVLPAVNASLNATCAVLLVAGFLAIRARRVTLHVVCMLIALGVSVLFLACYLYYHFVVLDGTPTGFKGEGLIRPVYFAVLLSHTVLATAVAPLALITVYLGLRGRLQRHVGLARWTLPLWLYVSVTGVLVYWMLYHLYPPA
jgi:protein SCO1/2/putative membrane protein